MRLRFLALVAVLAIVFSAGAQAHQPRIVSEGTTVIKNPEISQAFYGVLDGEPEEYRISSEEPFLLYVGLTVPDLPGIGKDISADVYIEHDGGGLHVNEPIFTLDGLAHEWTPFHEEFAGDDYFNGPEYEMEAEPGTYRIEVFSPDNQGKYVLAVGKIESFPPDEFINTILVLPTLKQDFFEKPAWTAYFNIMGIFLLVIIAVAAAIVLAAYKIARRFWKR